MNHFKLVLLLIVSMSAVLLVESNYAQESKNTPETKSDFRLPIYYGKLGVSDSQRKKLETIHASYERQLEELRKQLKAVVKERDAAMERALTDGQKLRLKELRVEAMKNKADGLKPKPEEQNAEN